MVRGGRSVGPQVAVHAGLETDKLIDVRDDFLEQVEHETAVYLLDDVRTWLGTNVFFAVLDADPDSPEWIVIAQVSDRKAALDFAEDMASYTEDESGSDMDSSMYRNTQL